VRRVSLIYTTGCRKYKALKQVLLDVGLPFEEIRQDRLHKGCVCRTFSSPTILLDNDIIIFGGPRQSRLEKESSELSYLKNIPNKKELRTLLEWIEV
jgi:hypothetical protein